MVNVDQLTPGDILWVEVEPKYSNWNSLYKGLVEFMYLRKPGKEYLRCQCLNGGQQHGYELTFHVNQVYALDELPVWNKHDQS